MFDPSQNKFLKNAENIGSFVTYLFHIIFLFLIGIIIVYAAFHEALLMVEKGKFTLDDILLLFIYLELVAMVGIYFTTHRMPVNFLIYVVVTALTRLMIGYIGTHHKPTIELLIIPAAILVLALAVMVNKFGRSHLVEQPRLKGYDGDEAKVDNRKNAAHLAPVPGESIFPPAPKN